MINYITIIQVGTNVHFVQFDLECKVVNTMRETSELSELLELLVIC